MMSSGRLLLGSLGLTTIVGASSRLGIILADRKEDKEPNLSDVVPSRLQQLSKVRGCSKEKPFDLLIIGGGATGAGCALDAATRGFKTVLIEREDFGSGTSSKSTKLVHGGVRYLEKAVFNLDYSQLKLVYEALHERVAFLRNASHLAHPLPIITPCYHWWEVPYYWAGLKAYDMVAGTANLIWSKYMGATESLSFFPTLAAKHPITGLSLKGSILYYDGQFDDARVNVSIVCTAAASGAATLNHFECQSLIKNDEGKVVGAKCQDTISGEILDVYAKVVINSTGPFVDGIRRQSNTSAPKTVTASSGTHVTLPAYYGSSTVGMIIPKTRDGRVLFLLPWLGCLIAGTTDDKCDVIPKPRATEEEIAFILESLGDILSLKVRRSDVLSTWTGIRPLASNPKATNTQSIVRDHIVYTDDDDMITVTGGKWTTYRKMAQDAVDAAVATGRLPLNAGPCVTSDKMLIGARGYRPTMHAELSQQCLALVTGSAAGKPSESSVVELDSAVAHHLCTSYGDRAALILKLVQEHGMGKKLVPHLPILEAEVIYAIQHEYCESPDDFLERRTRIAFLDAKAAVDAVPRVAEIMATQLGWSDERREDEVRKAVGSLGGSFFSAAK